MIKETIDKDIEENLILLSSDNNKALKFFENILSKDNNNILALNAVGIAFMKSGKYDMAEASFKSSLELEDNTVAYINLALINRIYEKTEESDNYFDKALKLNSNLEKIIRVLKEQLKQDKKKIKQCSIKTMNFDMNS